MTRWCDFFHAAGAERERKVDKSVKRGCSKEKMKELPGRLQLYMKAKATQILQLHRSIL